MKNVLDEAEKEQNKTEVKDEKLDESIVEEKPRTESVIEKPSSGKRSVRSSASSKPNSASSKPNSAKKSGRESQAKSDMPLPILEEKKRDLPSSRRSNETPIGEKFERSLMNFTPLTAVLDRTNKIQSTKLDNKKTVSTVQFDETSRNVDNNQGWKILN